MQRRIVGVLVLLLGLSVAARGQGHDKPVSPEEQPAFIAKSMSIAPRYKTVQLPAAGHD